MQVSTYIRVSSCSYRLIFDLFIYPFICSFFCLYSFIYLSSYLYIYLLNLFAHLSTSLLYPSVHFIYIYTHSTVWVYFIPWSLGSCLVLKLKHAIRQNIQVCCVRFFDSHRSWSAAHQDLDQGLEGIVCPRISFICCNCIHTVQAALLPGTGVTGDNGNESDW